MMGNNGRHSEAAAFKELSSQEALARLALNTSSRRWSLTEKGSEFLTLVKGSRTEIRKVVWPTRQETTQTTLIVFVFVIITGLILWGLDSVLGWLASLILG